MSIGKKIRVLIVDDSAIVRKALSEIVSAHPELEVAGTAPDPFVARDKILALKPDVLTLDIEMPRMDGLTFLKKLMKYHPLPVVMISSLAQSSSRVVIEALQSGAVEVVAKPGGPYSVSDLRTELANKIRAAAEAHLRPAPAFAEAAVLPTSSLSTGIIAIGSSTGGVEALRAILTSLPAEMPPIVIAQHIPAVFSAEFANRLNTICRIRVKEAADGDPIQPGWAFVAPGNFHLTVRKVAGGWRAVVAGGELVQYQRPSVDVLFESVAKQAASDAVGVILTGMGADGAAGLLAMKKAGAHTIAQDEASCVVFGMPREAIRMGGVDDVLPLDRIGQALAAYSKGPAVVA